MREELSTCEAPIMKIIWEAETEISIPELTKQLNIQYGKEYARTTVVTFLTRLAGKGYVTTQRRGRVSYVRALKSEQEYKQMLASRETEFWFHGSLAEFAQALSMGTPFTKEELQKVRELLDEMEKMEQEKKEKQQKEKEDKEKKQERKKEQFENRYKKQK